MNKKKLLYAAVIGTAAVYGINKSISILANSKSTLANSNGLQYQWRLGNIFYTKQGNGKPVLLVHDLTCASSDTEWKYIVRQYSKTNTVYTLDLIGCGRSDKPKVTYTNYMYAQLISDFIKNIINQKTDVVVTGASASFVLMTCFNEACFNDSTLFNKIVLINPSANKTSITRRQKLIKKFIELPIGTTIYNIANSKKCVSKLFRDEYYYNPSLIKRSVVHSYYDAAHYGRITSKYLYASIISNYTGINIQRAVKEINNSIFIIGSEYEPDINETIKEYTDLNPSIESTVIKAAKHLPQLERPSELLTQIKLFLS